MSSDPATVLASLRVYPIKSCAALDLNSAVVAETGLLDDRRMALFDDNGTVITGREYPSLLGLKIALADGKLQIGSVSGDTLTVPLLQSRDRDESVTLFNESVHGFEVDPDCSEWFSAFLKEPCRLMNISSVNPRSVLERRGGKSGDVVSFADECPLLLISEESLEDLNSRLDSPIPMGQLRPNITVTGCAPYAEETWSQIRIGEVVFDVAQTCKRCDLATVDPVSLQKHGRQEPLRTMAGYRPRVRGGVTFGVHLIPRVLGEIAVGSAVTPKSSPAATQIYE